MKFINFILNGCSSQGSSSSPKDEKPGPSIATFDSDHIPETVPENFQFRGYIPRNGLPNEDGLYATVLKFFIVPDGCIDYSNLNVKDKTPADFSKCPTPVKDGPSANQAEEDSKGINIEGNYAASYCCVNRFEGVATEEDIAASKTCENCKWTADLDSSVYKKLEKGKKYGLYCESELNGKYARSEVVIFKV